MLNISNKVQLFIIFFLAGLILSLGIYSRVLYSNNKDLSTTTSLLKSELVVLKIEKNGLENSIENQNKQIEEYRADYTTKLKELDEWKNKPPDIRYKDVIKFKEVKSNECEDIKNIISSLRSSSF